MTTTETRSLIEKILSNTKEKKISWQYLNQNMARWVGGIPPAYNVTIQMSPMGIINNVQALQYVLSVQKIPMNEMILQVISNPNNNPEYIPLLKELYELVIEKTQKESLNNFTNYLNNL